MRNLYLKQSITVKKNNIIVVALLLISLGINLLVMYLTPIFGDGAIYLGMVRSIEKNVSLFPDSQILPLFIIICSVVDKFIKDPKVSVDVLCLLSTVGYQYALYRLIKHFFSFKTAVISLFIVIFTPLTIWNNGHRLIDNFACLLGIATTAIFLWTINKKSIIRQVILSVIALMFLLTKQTSIITLLSLFLFLLIKVATTNRKVELIKKVVFVPFFLTLGLFIFRDYLITPYSFYIPEKLKKDIKITYINDEKVIVPSRYDYLEKIIITKNGSLPYLNDHIKNKNIAGILQYGCAFLINEQPSENELSPLGIVYWPIFLLVFISGVISLVKSKSFTNNDYVLLMCSFFVINVPFGSIFAILRYFYQFSTICVVILSIGIERVMFANKKIGILLAAITITCMVLVVYSQVILLDKYQNSYGHNIISENGAGLKELSKVGHDLPDIQNSTIFTPSSEPQYYLESKTIWDWRLFLVDSKEDIFSYLNKNNIKYLIIPKYSIRPTIWNGTKMVENNIENYSNSYVIPLDSIFYSVITNEAYFSKFADYKGFDVFEIKTQM